MNARTIIDEAGRVTIPESLREELHLQPGDAIDMESGSEQITLRPIRGSGSMRKKQGVWVLHTGDPLSASAADEILQQIREERDQANLGKQE
ncbi:MAG TPA: AbrB/MazE/SpoVT family DNA-binding domain-containing protein [Candidatus Angelobacter sp.]|jgi:AbrB family looped-hinge helix DNA binding protein|nr:AbrB/MazE/SpoVT family DNA-binding domain-containing protein [Candidatus Angelobacter sp.]